MRQWRAVRRTNNVMNHDDECENSSTFDLIELNYSFVSSVWVAIGAKYYFDDVP